MRKGVEQIQKRDSRRIWSAIAFLFGLLFAPMSAVGCGLDWTLPQSHFEGVEEHGYVAHWEKIGDIDLGNKVVLPVHLAFNSRQETASSVLGKGWTVALLESHIEPIDENAVSVLMPDGWKFLFLRNGNSETWRGNAGWVGETNDSIFTIEAPCRWKIKYDAGKIQEIDGSTVGALTYRYNAGLATEIDHEGAAVLQVERDPVSGLATALIVGGGRIEVSLGQRPRVMPVNTQNLITGFDPSLASMQWLDGRRESFVFGTDKSLNPTLTLDGTGQVQKTITWDAATRRVKCDGPWTYSMEDKGGHLRFSRVSAQGESEIYDADETTGMMVEKDAGGAETLTYRFVGGPLAGSVRKIEELESGGGRKPLYAASYYSSGDLMREIFGSEQIKTYSETGQLVKETIGGQVVYEQDTDGEGRVTRIVDVTRDLEIRKSFGPEGDQTTQVFQHGSLFYTEHIDHNNRLISLNEGEK